MKLNIMSFNTQHCKNYVTGRIDFDVMADAIRKCGADVIGLNEMRGAGVDPTYTAQVRTLARKLGYHYRFAPAIRLPQGPYGNGLLSRFPIIAAKVIPIPDPDPKVPGRRHYESRCILKARIGAGEGIDVLVTHFGLNPDEAENAVGTVLRSLSPRRCVLMGDFNLTPESPLLTPLRERLSDTARFFPAPLLSFPSDEPKRKIDYIFTTPDLRIVSADIPAVVASDHRPHTAVIEL